jgi:hypothetical protein
LKRDFSVLCCTKECQSGQVKNDTGSFKKQQNIILIAFAKSLF